MSIKALSCKCGDCLHWEIIEKKGEQFLKCKTCEEEYPITVTVPEHDQLEWIHKTRA